MASAPNPPLADWRNDPRLVEIDRLSRSGRLAEAIALAHAVDQSGLDHPMTLNLIAWDHREAGRLDEAIAALRRAVALDPAQPFLKVALGGCLAAADLTVEALAAFDEALARAPDFTPALAGRGRALMRLGAYDEAEPLLRRVLMRDPDHVDAKAALAGLAAQWGDHDTAIDLAGAVLRIAPENVEAALVFAESATAQRRHAEAEAELRRVLPRPGLTELDRATALNLLGDVLHAQGRHPAAFDAFAESNALYRRAGRDRFEAPGVERDVDKVERLDRYFAAASPEDWGRPAPASAPSRFARHVFLVGFPRSGTTLLENVFAAHPEVVGFDETPTLAEAVDAYFSSDDGLDRLARLDAAEADAQRRLHAHNVDQIHYFRSDKLLLEKLPLFSMHLPIVAKLFPDAKIVFALRDPRDVVLSCFRRRFMLNPSMYELTDLVDAARYYDGVMRLAHRYVEVLRPDVLFVKNEDLVADFEGAARKLCAFVGLPWSDDVLDFAAAARRKAIRTPSANQVRQGVNASGVGQWRAYRDQLQPVLPTLAPWVERFGYPAD